MKYRLPLLALLCVLPLFMAAGQAWAQTSRLYFAGYMGLSTFGDLDFSEKSTPASGAIKPSNAFSFAGAMGLRVDKQWRVEGEVSYRKAEMSTIDFSTTGSFDANGDFGTTLLMANVYYDIDLGWNKLQPFVTGGLGLAFHDVTIDDTSPRNIDASDSDFGVAWQAGTGLKYRIADDMAVSGGYRYLGGTPINAQGYEIDFSAHEFRVGLEYDLPFK